MLRRFVVNYIERHRHPVNQLLHLIGVPLTFGASIVFLVMHLRLEAAGCFVGGYLLQFLGHALEGNDAGEVVLIKKLLRKPYREFGPLSKESKSDD
ncbi:MAG: DUF962 domain-containing protein [Planctomycetes bacterium]|nr:DUF962 domain-containing protein [Planctomycetota bacterium]